MWQTFPVLHLKFSRVVADCLAPKILWPINVVVLYICDISKCHIDKCSLDKIPTCSHMQFCCIICYNYDSKFVNKQLRYSVVCLISDWSQKSSVIEYHGVPVQGFWSNIKYSTIQACLSRLYVPSRVTTVSTSVYNPWPYLYYVWSDDTKYIIIIAQLQWPGHKVGLSLSH